MKKSKEKLEPKSIENRKARFDYAIAETVEAGLILVGSEVKSVFAGRANLTDGYVRISGDEAWLINCDIEPYENGLRYGHERRRDRKLLLHKKEIKDLHRQAQEKGMSLVPLKIYFSHFRAKLLIGVGRGKSQYDKRHQLKADEIKREIQKIKRQDFSD